MAINVASPVLPPWLSSAKVVNVSLASAGRENQSMAAWTVTVSKSARCVVLDIYQHGDP